MMNWLPTVVAALGLLISQTSGTGTLGVGVGFGRSSQPYTEALSKLRGNGVSILKNWSVNPDWLDAVESVYSDVRIVAFLFIYFIK
jgi:hypothetical protein